MDAFQYYYGETKVTRNPFSLNELKKVANSIGISDDDVTYEDGYFAVTTSEPNKLIKACRNYFSDYLEFKTRLGKVYITKRKIEL